jgi:apolipoprotein N-acyltransferase
MRAIENTKPVIRGTNNGITAIIDHRGQFISQLDQFTSGELTGEVIPRHGETPFSRYASWPVVIFCLIIILGLGSYRLRIKILGD